MSIINGKNWRKLSLDESRKIKKLLKNGESIARIASKYKISKSQLYHIKKGDSYQWDT